jgi:hypothetical protein
MPSNRRQETIRSQKRHAERLLRDETPNLTTAKRRIRRHHARRVVLRSETELGRTKRAGATRKSRRETGFFGSLLQALTRVSPKRTTRKLEEVTKRRKRTS